MCQVGGITIKNKEYSEHTRKYLESLGVTNYQSHYKVPCGQCKDCLQARANSWLVRLRSHMKDTFSSYFVTLTYENPPRTYNGLYTAKKTIYNVISNVSVNLKPITTTSNIMQLVNTANSFNDLIIMLSYSMLTIDGQFYVHGLPMIY